MICVHMYIIPKEDQMEFSNNLWKKIDRKGSLREK
jgi:hypothetical protein